MRMHSTSLNLFQFTMIQSEILDFRALVYRQQISNDTFYNVVNLCIVGYPGHFETLFTDYSDSSQLRSQTKGLIYKPLAPPVCHFL